MKRIIICILLVSSFIVPQTFADTTQPTLSVHTSIPKYFFKPDNNRGKVLLVDIDSIQEVSAYAGVGFVIVNKRLVEVLLVNKFNPDVWVSIKKSESSANSWRIWELRYSYYLYSKTGKSTQ